MFQAFGVSKDGIKTKSGKGDQASEGETMSQNTQTKSNHAPQMLLFVAVTLCFKRRTNIDLKEKETEWYMHCWGTCPIFE